jgi:hypothetical protein
MQRLAGHRRIGGYVNPRSFTRLARTDLNAVVSNLGTFRAVARFVRFSRSTGQVIKVLVGITGSAMIGMKWPTLCLTSFAFGVRRSPYRPRWQGRGGLMMHDGDYNADRCNSCSNDDWDFWKNANRTFTAGIDLIDRVIPHISI